MSSSFCHCSDALSFSFVFLRCAVSSSGRSCSTRRPGVLSEFGAFGCCGERERPTCSFFERDQVVCEERHVTRSVIVLGVTLSPFVLIDFRFPRLGNNTGHFRGE